VICGSIFLVNIVIYSASLSVVRGSLDSGSYIGLLRCNYVVVDLALATDYIYCTGSSDLNSIDFSLSLHICNKSTPNFS
jgi:hypothetical protein